MVDIKNKKLLLSYLKSQRLMSVATHVVNSWVCCVYYAVDDKFNLYFVSEPDTKHIKDIIKNKNVACAIFDSHQKVTDKKIGVQIQAVASEVKEKREILSALKLWNKNNPGIEDIINFKNLGKVIKSKVYKIEPKIIKFFNEQLYGSEGSKIFNF